jgi:hypothetical protein
MTNKFISTPSPVITSSFITLIKLTRHTISHIVTSFLNLLSNINTLSISSTYITLLSIKER